MASMIDYIRSIVERRPIELDSDYNQYALNSYFSKFRNCVKLIDNISQYKLSNEMHYRYLLSVLPYGWQKKVEYKDPNDKYSKDIENIKKYYKVNNKIAESYLIVMSDNELKFLRELYNV